MLLPGVPENVLVIKALAGCEAAQCVANGYWVVERAKRIDKSIVAGQQQAPPDAIAETGAKQKDGFSVAQCHRVSRD